MNPNVIVISHGTYVGPSGATGPATYSFMTKDYKPPAEDRYLDYDVVKNQNGKFKYVYDNGPGFRKWAPFSIVCEEVHKAFLGTNASGQYLQLREMWNFKGVLGIRAPEGVYNAHWSREALERAFRVFPNQVGDTIENEVIIQIEEA